jgi:uncharacterized ferritin-like protein (DUF455 family)
MSAQTMQEIGFFELAGLKLRANAARDAHFNVVMTDAELEEYEGTSDIARRELVHRHMSNEITSLDIAAQCVYEYPDAPWELRMELARQCWDESRHIAALKRRLEEMGGHPGEFPIALFEWSITCAIESLVGRLASQNRTFESGAMDVVGNLIQRLRAAGDEATAEMLDAILADEIQHVRFANRWIRKLAEQDRRTLLKVAMAVRFVDAVNRAMVPAEGLTNKVGKTFEAPEARVPIVNIEDRKLAEFSDEEIHEILRQAGFRALVTAEAPAP